MSRWWALLIAVAVATAATAGPGVAAAAKPGGGGQSDSASAVDTQTLQTIDSILSAAQGEMANIASEFVADAPAVESEAELEGMRETAEFRIGLRTVWPTLC